jgi:hypothetical protein
VESTQLEVKATPAKQAKAKADAKLKVAQDAIQQDDHVQAIKAAFNAEVDGKTIKPIEINKE